jgi:regulator of protease activity HflC (stomatin/prohibitin superfamily)
MMVTTRDTLTSVPTGTIACPFGLRCTSSDHQSITINGTATFLFGDAKKLEKTFDFSVSPKGQYLSEDPDKIGDRLAEILASTIFSAAGKRELNHLLSSQESLSSEVAGSLVKDQALAKTGISLSSLAITSTRPSPEIEKALEAIRSEELKKNADAAIHERQMAAELQDRMLKQEQIQTSKKIQQGETELVEAKMETEMRNACLEKEVQEIHLDKDKALQVHNHEQKKLAMSTDAEVARIHTGIVNESAANTVAMGEAQGKSLQALADAIKDLDPKTIQSLALQGGDAKNTIAAAFLELAEKAGSIGTLNITPDLLDSLTKREGK